MKLTFLGAAGTVTGSMTLVETGGRRVLVDCGLHQGDSEERQRDWQPFAFEPASLDAVVLTHAHLDHCGMLPRLVAQGYEGRITATAGTRDLAGVILPDSAHLQEEAAEHARRFGWSRHEDPQPLYTAAQAEATLARFDGHPYDVPVDLGGGVSVHFRDAGHIVGSSSVVLSSGGLSVLHSGDVGRDDKPIGPPPAPVPAVDGVVIEGTYGDRLHEHSDPLDQLADVIGRTVARGGVVLVPAFAVGRTQMLMYLLYRLRREGRTPWVPVWMDSPMARRATAVYRRHHQALGLPLHLVEDIEQHTRVAETPEESAALDHDPEPMVLLSASGMVEGGRVLHHVKALGGSPRNTILLAGFQAPGTRGAALVAGERYLKIHGDDVHVRAEVANLTTLSAHADQRQLLAWLGGAERPPRQVWVNHGLPEVTAHFAQRITDELHLPALAVEHQQTVELSAG